MRASPLRDPLRSLGARPDITTNNKKTQNMNDPNNRKRQSFNKIRGTMGMAMGVIYLLIAVCVIYFEKVGQIDIGEVFSYLVGGLMAGYGIFRIYRGYKQMKGEGYL